MGLVFNLIVKMIVKKLLFLFCGILLYTSARAQDTTPTAPSQTKSFRSHARPDLPGNFVLEFGFNRPFDKPTNFNPGFWGSRTLNIYYQYEIRILKSNFSFVPGIGFGLERYKFVNNYFLDNSNGTVTMLPAANFPLGNVGSLKKSQLITNYFDVPVEFRFSTQPEDPSKGFKVSVGGRVGYLFDSFTKIKYSEDGETKKLKDYESFNLNKFRYSLSAKIGIGNFAIFGYYNLSTLFKDGQDPGSGNSATTHMKNFTIGISLSSF